MAQVEYTQYIILKFIWPDYIHSEMYKPGEACSLGSSYPNISFPVPEVEEMLNFDYPDDQNRLNTKFRRCLRARVATREFGLHQTRYGDTLRKELIITLYLTDVILHSTSLVAIYP